MALILLKIYDASWREETQVRRALVEPTKTGRRGQVGGAMKMQMGQGNKRWGLATGDDGRRIYWRPVLYFILSYNAFALVSPSHAVHEHLCLEEDYTNDLPIFIEKRSICNFDTAPVPVYSIKITPDTDYETKFCLKGEYAETFNITKENELKLFGRLEQPETHLKLQIIRTANDIVGTPRERRQAINAIQFIFTIEDCNHVSWQTIVVAILSSVCVALMSTLAIMLILYQQKGLIKTGGSDDDRVEEMPPYQASDEAFINPRKTSSYDFGTLSKHSESTLERMESEKL